MVKPLDKVIYGCHLINDEELTVDFKLDNLEITTGKLNKIDLVNLVQIQSILMSNNEIEISKSFNKLVGELLI